MTSDHQAFPLETEAATLGCYLVGWPIDGQRGCNCVPSAAASPLSPERLLRRAIRQPWLLGFIDGALALRRPGSGLRRRLRLMFAILETSPFYCDSSPRPIAGACRRRRLDRGAGGAVPALGIVISRLLR